MAWIAVGAAAVSAVPAIFKGINGMNQTSTANGMHPINPGYQVNRGVIANAKTLSDEYGNYQLPGYSTMQQNVNSTFQNGFNSGVQGATSGGDVLDLATKMAYGKNQALNQLGVQNAQGKQQMRGEYLNGQAAAGMEYQHKNDYDRDQYDQQLREKAALTQSGAANTYGAMDQIAGAIGKYGFSKANAAGGTSERGDAIPNAKIGGVTNDTIGYAGNGVTMSPFNSNTVAAGSLPAPKFTDMYGGVDMDTLKKYIAKNGIK